MGRWLGVLVLIAGCSPALDDPEFAHDPASVSVEPESARGRASTGTPCDQIVAVATAEENRGPSAVGQGLTGYPGKLASYLGAGEAWCSEFVSWVYKVAGYPLSGGSQGGWMLKDSYALRSWFQKNTEFVSKGSASWSTFNPEPGDFIRYNTSSGGHSGMVRGISGTTLLTVEGNVNNKVLLLKLQSWRSYASIDGIGRRKLGCTAPPPQPDLGPGPAPDLSPGLPPDRGPDLRRPDLSRRDLGQVVADQAARAAEGLLLPLRPDAGPPTAPGLSPDEELGLTGGCALEPSPRADLLPGLLLFGLWLLRRRGV